MGNEYILVKVCCSPNMGSEPPPKKYISWMRISCYEGKRSKKKLYIPDTPSKFWKFGKIYASSVRPQPIQYWFQLNASLTKNFSFLLIYGIVGD